MAATKNIIAGSPSAADTLELGQSGGIVQVAAGADFALFDVGAITASSTDSQAAATELSYTINKVTSGADGHAVKLPAASTCKLRIASVTSGAYAMKVYPASGDNINYGSDDAAVTIKEATLALFVSDGTNWLASYTANS